MKKLLLGLVLSSILFLTNIQAQQTEKQILVSQIEVLQGVVVLSDSPECIYIDTIDGNGWVLEVTNEENEGELLLNDDVMVIFDNMGTADIYDDEIIRVVKIN